MVGYPGDNQTYISDFIGDLQIGNFFYSFFITPSIIDNQGWSDKSIFYDVSVLTSNSRYTKNSDVDIIITIKNIGDQPDKDSILEYYLLDSNGNKINYNKEILYQVPPITFKGTQCSNLGGEIEHSTDRCISVLKRTLHLPDNSELGEWEVGVDYNVIEAPINKAITSFYVIDYPWWVFFLMSYWWLIILVILIIILLVLLFKMQFLKKK